MFQKKFFTGLNQSVFEYNN